MIYIDNQYFLNYNFIKLLIKTDSIAILPNNPYSKGWYTNKCSIVGANGVINLSVPLQGGRNQKSKIEDVKIAYSENWSQQHLRSIRSCYGNAPYFDYYYPIIQNVYLKNFEFLFDLNFSILKEINRILKINTKIEISNDAIAEEDIFFTKRNILKNSEQYLTSIKYPQVFEDRLGFTPNLSIIDLIMCMGPQSKELLLS